MTPDYQTELNIIGQKAQAASRQLAVISTLQKNRCLETIAKKLRQATHEIIAENKKDLEKAKIKNIPTAMIDRLTINSNIIENMAVGLETLVGLTDPVKKILSTWIRPNGLKIEKISIPIGVISIIYESRPNVTVDASGLCLKAGNAVILRGGSDAFHSNQKLNEIMLAGCKEQNMPEGTIQLIPWTDHNAVQPLLKMHKYIDLIIPRGGKNLINTVVENSTIPVIKHYEGVCHIYVDEDANQEKALNIIENAKCQRPGVCNAAETILIHQNVAEEFVPKLMQIMEQNKVEVRGCQKFCQISKQALPTTEEDWYKEYLDLIVSIKIVENITEAIQHIAKYGSGHSDAIISENKNKTIRFSECVDSAAVYINASTRFTDGAMFGMGAEIGISTDRIHARGPMGLEELNTYKYLVSGNGQIRD